jgi:chromosome condensin MukBEF complex kleisin-like MukF subunit
METPQASLIIRLYRADLQERLHSCEAILSHTSSLLSTLNDLKLGFSAVADQTSSFQIQCNTLVEEEVTTHSTLF